MSPGNPSLFMSVQAAIRDDPSMVLPGFLVKILATPIHMSATASSIHVTSTQMSNLSLAELKQLYTVSYSHELNCTP